MTDQPDFFDEDPGTAKALRIAKLIAGYLTQSLTPAEHDELDEWVGQSDANMKVFEELTDEAKLREGLDFIEDAQTARMRKKLKETLSFNRSQVHSRYSIKQYAAAACLMLLVGVSAYLLFRNNSKQPNHIAEIVNQHQDLQPGRDKAILTLADGSVISLDDQKNGTLATQQNSDVIKDNGKLIYNNTGNSRAVAILYNTVSTPRGGGYQLTLSDGTKIWLNAASSITFPAAFAGKERKVSVTGEAYFEVAKNKAMPFTVEIKGRDASVQVLGTHFNINAYSDEPVVKTTLLEGSVKFVSGEMVKDNKIAFLKPGQQAQLTEGAIKVESGIDVDAVMAWKNGMFRFNNTDLRSIMKQVSRWYDVDIEFQTTTNPGYTSLLSRNLPASKLFAVLEENGGVHFKIDGKKVVVLP